MLPRMVFAEYLSDYIIHLRFADGTEGDVNLTDELDGEIFAPLKKIEFFKRFRLNPELHTIDWPNGADLAPEFLYEELRKSI